MAGLKRAAVNHEGSDGAIGLGDVTQQDERAAMELLDWATSHSKTRGQRWSYWTGRRHTARREGSDGAIGLGDVTQQDERAAMELLDWATSHLSLIHI